MPVTKAGTFTRDAGETRRTWRRLHNLTAASKVDFLDGSFSWMVKAYR